MLDKIVFFISNTLLFLLSLLPLKITHGLGSLLGKLLYLSKSESYRISCINIKMCFPELEPQQQQHLIKQSLQEMAKAVCELGYIWKRPVNQVLDKMSVEGFEEVKKCSAQNQGVIVLTPHLGCWEIAGLFIAQHIPFTTLYQPPKLKAIDPIIQHSRERSGTHLVKADKRGIASIFRALKSGKATGILPDQTPHDKNSGIFSPIFDQLALTMTLIYGFTQKTQSKIFLGYAKRLPNGEGYQYNIFPADKDIYSENKQVAIDCMNRHIEQMIRECPEQYLWSYKRYKQRPGDSPQIY